MRTSREQTDYQDPVLAQLFFYAHGGIAPFQSPKENLKWKFLLDLVKGTNPMKIFRVYLLSESPISDHLVKVNEHLVYLRN